MYDSIDVQSRILDTTITYDKGEISLHAIPSTDVIIPCNISDRNVQVWHTSHSDEKYERGRGGFNTNQYLDGCGHWRFRGNTTLNDVAYTSLVCSSSIGLASKHTNSASKDANISNDTYPAAVIDTDASMGAADAPIQVSVCGNSFERRANSTIDADAQRTSVSDRFSSSDDENVPSPIPLANGCGHWFRKSRVDHGTYASRTDGTSSELADPKNRKKFNGSADDSPELYVCGHWYTRSR